MPGPLAALLVGQGVKSAYQFGKGKGWWGKQPPGRKQSSQEALYGEELKRRTKEGTMSPAVQMAIKNKALQSSYGAAQRGATDIGARLSGQGFEGSAIIGEAAKPLYSDAINKAGEVSSDLSIQNEMSKAGAFKDLAAYGAGESSRKYQNALSKYNYKTGAMDQAVSGFADIAGGVAGHYANQFGKFDVSKYANAGGGYNTEQIWNDVLQMDDQGEAQKLIQMLMLQGVFDEGKN